jgi:endonuclease/exonuclease/phosphatase family metal-dependent hydrolase
VTNLHLHHLEEEENIRTYQMKSILKWIEFNNEGVDVSIIVGDYNAVPESDTYKMIVKNGYVSSYKAFNGQEPESTFHNAMDAPTKDSSDNGTFDYIL